MKQSLLLLAFVAVGVTCSGQSPATGGNFTNLFEQEGKAKSDLTYMGKRYLQARITRFGETTVLIDSLSGSAEIPLKALPMALSAENKAWLQSRPKAGQVEKSDSNALAATPAPITSEEWALILTAIQSNTRTVSKNKRAAYDLPSAINDAAFVIVREAGKKTPPTSKENHIGLTGKLLLWYSREIRTSFRNADDRQKWQAERIAFAQMLKAERQSWGAVVDQSWKNLMSACHILGFPPGSLPE